MSRLVPALICAIALLASSASTAAAAPLGVLGVSGSTGAGNGQFQGTGGVAVNEASGDVYVIDVDGSRVQRFNATGEFQDAFGSAGTGDGQFDFSGGLTTYNKTSALAIDQADGSVYVADVGNDRIQKFSAAGDYQAQIGHSGSGDGELSRPQGVAVDPVDASVYIADTGNYRVQKFTSTGTYDTQFGSRGDSDGQFSEGLPDEEGRGRGAIRVGVDSTGRVYVLDYSLRVQRFTSAGEFDAVLDTSSVSFITELAVDQAGDHVFVGDYYGKVAELDGGGALVDVHPSGAPIEGGTLSGIGVKDGGLAYAAGKDGYDGSLNSRLFRFGVVTPASLTLQAASDLGATTATVNATVNPNGAPAVTYQVEYSSDFVTFTTVPVTPVSLGDGTVDVPVSQALTGLDVNTMYAYRFIIKRPYNATIEGDYDIFSTEAIAPTVSGTVGYPSEQTARLTASVNPHGLESTYRFEYGRDTSYGSVMPATSKVVGDGRDPVRVVQTVGGLDPATTYHFRVVTTNAAGTTEGPDVAFTTKPAGAPASGTPDGGSGPFEQVSPVEKDNADVIPTKTIQLSRDGNGAVFASAGTFAGARAGVAQGYYVASRGTANWSTRGLSLPQSIEEAINFKVTLAVSDDRTHAVQISRVALTPGAISGDANLYMEDLRTGALTLMGTGPGRAFSSVVEPYARPFPGATDDFAHLLLNSRGVFTPDAPDDDSIKLYLWSGQVLRFVGIDEDGNGVEAGGGSVLAGSHPVSEDGSRVFYDKRIASTTLGVFMWENGHAKELSKSQRAGVDPNAVQDGRFWAATPDGGTVLFSSGTRLTDDPADEGGLYRYEVATEQLTLLNPGSSGFTKVHSTTPDLRQVYFEDNGRVDGASAPPPGTLGSMYVARRDGTVHRILSFEGGGQTNGIDISPSGRFASISAFGVVGFDERSDRCPPDLDFGRANTDGRCGMVFAYDDAASELRCAACAETPAGGAASGRLSQRQADVSDFWSTTVLDDGSIFFSTPTKLVATDVNGRRDVYRWRDGTATLVSPGSAAADAELIGVAGPRDDVFFTTNQRLVGQDQDSSIDLYVSRAGGGLTGQAGAGGAQMAYPCEGDSCQGAPGSGATPPGVGSITFAGPGDPVTPPTAAGSAKAKVTVTSRTVRGTAFSLKVKVPGRGAVTVTGTRTSGVTKRVTRATTYTVRVRLSPRAQADLRRRGSLTATVRVTYRTSGGKATSTSVSLKFLRPVSRSSARRNSMPRRSASIRTGR